jgi:hypothetical protein
MITRQCPAVLVLRLALRGLQAAQSPWQIELVVVAAEQDRPNLVDLVADAPHRWHVHWSRNSTRARVSRHCRVDPLRGLHRPQ